MSVAKGEVYALRGGRGEKVVVLSADEVNTITWPWCAPIIRRFDGSPELAVFAPSTHETDPVSGTIMLLDTAQVSAELLEEPVGTLVGVTVARIEAGIKALFGLM